MRITRYEDLMVQYENPIDHACDMEVGQVFVSNGWEKPEGFCQSAWDTLSPFVLALSHGGENFYDGWMKNPKSAMLSCNDGFRPVSFLVEALDEDADRGGNVMFENKIAVVTGGAKGIGKAIAEEFQKAGAKVCVIDLLPNDYYVGDLADQAVLEDFARKVIADYGHVDFLVNNALPLMKGIDTCTYEEFNYALRVGVTAPFYLTKLFAPHFAPGAAIVNISSSRDRMSQPQTESYTAAKGGISALTHALAVSLAGKVRVNSISPGWIDTGYTVYEGPDAIQQPAGRVGNPLDIANMVLYLCSDKAGFITGENICIDGGMTRQMIYHNDFGWTLGGNL